VQAGIFGIQTRRATYPYRQHWCVTVNDEVVHGIPTEDKILQDGDLVMLDLGLSYNGYFADMAVTMFVGKGDKEGEQLMNATREALADAIKTHDRCNHR